MILTSELLKHEKESNKELVEKLISYIKEEKITSLEELKLLEDKVFTVNSKVLNIKQRIKYCFDNIKGAYYDYDGLSLEEINNLKQLKDSINKDISDEERVINLIKINLITNRELMFIEKAYKYVINEML